MKVVRLSAPRTGRLYHPGNIPGTHFCYRLSQAQGHSAAGRIVSMKNSNDIIWNRTRDLPTCSAVPQPTAPPRARNTEVHFNLEYTLFIKYFLCESALSHFFIVMRILLIGMGGANWIRLISAGTTCVLLRTRQWTYGFLKVGGIYLLRGFWLTNLVSQSVSHRQREGRMDGWKDGCTESQIKQNFLQP